MKDYKHPFANPARDDQEAERPLSPQIGIERKTTRREWRSWKLRKWWTIPILLVNVAIIAVIIALERVSTHRNGITQVREVAPFSFSHFSVSSAVWSNGLLWTSLPSFFMAVYQLTWASLVTATADRQPFIELQRPREQAKNVRQTVMLNYRSYASFYGWITALYYEHWLLGFAMFLSVLLSIAVVPLTAHIFAAAGTDTKFNTTITFLNNFDGSALTTSDNLLPSFSVGTAALVYGATPPPWMTTEYAFEPFEISGSMSSPLGNVTADIVGFSAYLDCEIKTSSEYNATVSNGTDATISFNDRGCQVDNLVVPTNSNYTLAQTFADLDCTSQSGFSRFGIIAGQNITSNTNTNAIANMSVISCIPSYWETGGALTVAMSPDAAPTYLSFDPLPGNSTIARPNTWYNFEYGLPFYTAYDPSNTFSGDSFGFFIYQYARKLSPSSPFEPLAVLNATEFAFTAMYAAVANTFYTVPALATGNHRQVPAVLSVNETRLYVVTAVAYTVVALLLLVFVCTILMIVYTERHHSILLGEEPVGLLGLAAVLERSDINQFVTEYHTSSDKPVRRTMREAIKKDYSWQDSRAYYDPVEQRIRIEGLGPR